MSQPEVKVENGSEAFDIIDDVDNTKRSTTVKVEVLDVREYLDDDSVSQAGCLVKSVQDNIFKDDGSSSGRLNRIFYSFLKVCTL